MTCGRPRRADGRPCQSHRVVLPPLLGAQSMFRVTDIRLPESCCHHLTAAERALMDSLRAREAAELARIRAQIDPDPACWRWPVTAEHRARVAAIYACNGPVVRERSMRLLRDWQDGRCAICGTGVAEVTDHDHKTTLVRGRLCKSCNVREGFDPDGPFARYRLRYPVAILGLPPIRYYSPITGWAEPAAPYDRWRDNPMKGVGL